MKTYPIKELKRIAEFKQAVMDNYGLQHYVLVLLLLNTGMSILEVLPLRWEQIMNGKDINRYILFKGKKIYLNENLRNSLICLRKIYSKNVYVFQTKHLPTVDAKPKPCHWKRDYIFVYLRSVGKQLDMDVSVMTLRKTFVYHAIVTFGKNPYWVQNFLEHRNLEKTLEFADIPKQGYLEEDLFEGINL